MSDIEIVLGTIPRIRNALRAREYRAASGAKLSEHQLRILGHLDDVDPAMVGELADFMGVTASTMSLNLKRLETSGLITRTRDPADRRVVNVLLTPEGRSLRDGAPALDPDRIDAMLRSIRPGDRKHALEGLAILVEAADRLQARHVDYLEALAGGGGEA